MKNQSPLLPSEKLKERVLVLPYYVTKFYNLLLHGLRTNVSVEFGLHNISKAKKTHLPLFFFTESVTPSL